MRAHAVPGAVPLEGVDAALAHELPATIDEPLLVFGIGEVEFGLGRDEPLFLRLGGALLVAAITAQRRDPDAQVGAQRIHLDLGRGESAGEFLFVLDPEALGRLVPAIVDEVGEHGYAPFLHELRVEGPDHVEHPRFIDAEPEVIPAVVMQEGAAGAGALALEVAQQRATELAGRGESGDRAEVVGLLRGERQRTTEGGAAARRGDEVGRSGHLDSREEAGTGERAARTGADLFQARRTYIGELDAMELIGLAFGRQEDRLPEVVGPVAQFGSPARFHAASRGEIGLQGLTVLEGKSAHLAHDAESGSRQVARGERRELRRGHAFARRGRHVKRPPLVADADQQEGLTVIPDEGHGRRPRQGGVGAAIDARGKAADALGPGQFADDGPVGGPLEAEARLARGRRVDFEDAAFTHGAGLAGVILGLGLEVHLAHPEQLRVAREISAGEGGDLLQGFPVGAGADDHAGILEVDLDLIGAVARRHRGRRQAEELGAALVDLGAADFVRDFQRVETPAAELPGGREHLVLQQEEVALRAGLSLAGGGSGEVDVRVRGL